MPRRTRRPSITQRNYVRERRKAKGWTQIDLSAHSGVSQSVISDFERQLGWMEYESLVAIADALDCEFLELFVDPNAPDLNAMAADMDDSERARIVRMLKAMRDPD